MRILVKVIPNARKNEVKLLGEGRYQVRVTAPPVKGKANEKVIELLAEYFGKPKRSISIVRGLRTRDKVVEIS